MDARTRRQSKLIEFAMAQKASRGLGTSLFASSRSGANAEEVRMKEALKHSDFLDIVRRAQAGHDLEKYADAHFDLYRKGVFNSKTTISKMLAWKSDIISKPLRKLNAELKQDAVSTFKAIVHYMGDKGRPRDPNQFALRILKVRLCRFPPACDRVLTPPPAAFF